VIEIGYSLKAYEGRSGDRAVVVNRQNGVLMCAIDGLGHGDAAADAADTAARYIETTNGEPLEEILARCHQVLMRTRGAVLTLADFDLRRRHLEWVGVGNVEARLLPMGRARVPGQMASATLFGGVLGHNLPTVRSSGHDVSVGDLMVMATDGVRADFATDLVTSGSPKSIAERVLERSARGDDDALVLVARFLGGWR
jgi:negative regulator of sigma-B (phosphoserine phosphatase)